MKAALIYPEWREAIKSLTTEERGELLNLILDYTAGDEVEPTTTTVAAAWGFVKLSLDNNSAKYDEISAKRAAASKKAIEARKAKQDQTSPNDTKRNQTSPNDTYIKVQSSNIKVQSSKLSNESALHAPAREEVVEFFLNEKATVEQADRFFNYWEAAGWIRGGTPLKAWQPSARQWILEDYRKQSQQPKTQANGRNKGTAGGEIAAAEDYTSEF